ncbi:methylated-DNA--[protein]-cysteine S-methyltransferase [Agromyces intestinalis]|uniref:Methylated-DNA--protein-cysteine methyltransferase n=1 Tax=Agromyces intestinalis TaxID=2592652 RepID=A0A5C1YHA4_9MICO|nr:methylated-DNA--[protein]-cysteine S-methyltransferase [Agromyces intestinalis]QEO14945.1 methylated-DNA--[protein]-cysteine S-methyltransferase [Agromyces intestinalis]
MTLRHTTLASRLGDLLVTLDGEALTGLYFPAHWHPPAAAVLGVDVDPRGEPVVRELGRQLGEYLEGARTAFDLPLAPVGDEFQHAVWTMLREIPYGTTTTYGALAERLGDRNLARRVGGAVGRNPISIIVPCHRVVGADGSLTGYAGGLDRKRTLLELEGAAVVAQTRLF